jgi:hypothetical protein
MISPDIQMLDINPYQWRHLFDLFFTNRARQLIIIHENGRVLKAFDTQHGLRPDLKTQSVSDPPSLALQLYRAEQVDQVWVLERAALSDYSDALRTIYNPDEDGDRYFQRARLALDDNPQLVRYPPRPRGMYLAGISYEAFEKLIGRVPAGGTLVLGVFDEHSIWASLILRVERGKVGLITTTDAIMPIDVRIEDWRPAARLILDRVAAQIGAPFAGLFCAREAFIDLVTGDDKLAHFKALKTEGSIIFDPCPPDLPA